MHISICAPTELARKIEQYTTTGWWVPAAAKQATPMMCILKKNGTLRTVFNLWQQNKNMWKDVTPFPDQVTIRHDIAQAKFRSKLDMTEAYEQTCIRPEDVGKMTFSIIFSTFQSRVMQIGDCNAPSIFQWLMTTIFWDFLGRFVHEYLDDIFIYYQSIWEHIEHTMKVLQQLKESQFYLSKSKLDLFSDRTDCLGHVINDNGIHAVGQNAANQGMENSPKLQWSPKIPSTSAIPGPIHARYNSIYHTIIRIGTKQPNLPVDTTTG